MSCTVTDSSAVWEQAEEWGGLPTGGAPTTPSLLPAPASCPQSLWVRTELTGRGSGEGRECL